MTDTKFKEYLGDSVYADYENGMIKLTTENGNGASNTIFLELEVYYELGRYVARLKEIAGSMREVRP